MVNRGMGGRGLLIPMAVQAMHRGVVRVHDHHRHRDSGGNQGINVPGGIVAGPAVATMGGQDVRPVQDRMTVGTKLGIDLAEIGRAHGHRVVNRPAGGAVIMTGKVGGMAILALAGLTEGRALAQPGGSIVTGETAANGMDLTGANEGGDGSDMTSGAIRRRRSDGRIDLHR